MRVKDGAVAPALGVITTGVVNLRICYPSAIRFPLG